MGRIVAIGGGEPETAYKIHQYIAGMAGKAEPRVLFIGTASHDNEEYSAYIHSDFEGFGCTVEDLRLSGGEVRPEEIDGLLAQADILYVGGGDTAYMMEVWRKYGLDEKLKEIYREDRAILSGLSAGAMCWFRCGHSDSAVFEGNEEGGFGWVENLLGIYPYAFCPHYDLRVESFDRMLGALDVPGLAVEENAAFVDDNGAISYIASTDTATAYLCRYEDGRLVKEAQPMKRL